MWENRLVGPSMTTLAYPSGLMVWENWSFLILAAKGSFYDFNIAMETLQERMTPSQSIGSYLVQVVTHSGRNLLHVAVAHDSYGELTIWSRGFDINYTSHTYA
jgi:hypothetical protein